MDQIDPDLLFSSDTEKTFEFEDSFPSLPIPPLNHTLERYLDSVKPHLTDEEYRQTEFIVQQFASGVGKELHHKLLERSKHLKNWLEKWWEDYAYLDFRLPTSPLVNFAGPGPYMHHYLPPKEGTQVERAALVMHFSLKFWQLIRTERLRIDQDSKGRKFCMNQFHRAYSTCKIPGVKRDKLLFYFKTESEGDTPINMIVMCRGRIFNFDAIDENGEPLTPPELQRQFQYVRDICDSAPPGPGVGQLTGDMRTTWAQNRSRLISLHPQNYENLELIQKSVIITILDDYSPKDESELFEHLLAGDPLNKWADKSPDLIFYKNGLVGTNADHAPMDAMVLVASTYYVDLNVRKCKGKWQGSTSIRDLPRPKELVFKLDGNLEEAIQNARQVYNNFAVHLSCCAKHFQEYGKNFLRKHKLHPDTHVQLAMQYAYYKMYKKPAPTYETATTRKYYHARTETLRSCTVEAIDFCKVMLDSGATDEKKYQFYLQAANKHNKLMAEATDLRGCDRHLMGLYLTALEEGMPIPLLYEDKAYTKSGGGGNFILSTSFTGYTSVYGCVAPMMETGYGCFYRIEAGSVSLVVSSWKSCAETNAEKFNSQVHHCLQEMGQLIQNSVDVGARL